MVVLSCGIASSSFNESEESNVDAYSRKLYRIAITPIKGTIVIPLLMHGFNLAQMLAADIKLPESYHVVVRSDRLNAIAGTKSATH